MHGLIAVKRVAGVVIALSSAALAIFVVGIASGMLPQLGDVVHTALDIDPWLMVIPFFGLWPIVIPISFAGVCAGFDLVKHASDSTLAANIPSAIIAAGLGLFAYGLWAGHRDCTTGPPDGLCWLIGSALCSVSIMILVAGSVAFALRGLGRAGSPSS